MERTLVLSPPHRLLIINADDLGVSSARDAGILDCFAAGAISSASLLVDGAHAPAAAAAAGAAGLPLGLHLNLTEGARATSCSLTDPDGLCLGKHGLREALAAARVRHDDLVAEIRRQFDRFIALTGELPSHVDGHHHIHVEPQVAAALARIMAREYGVYCVRLPREAGLAEQAAAPEFEADFQRRVVHATAAAAVLFAAEGLYSTEAFLGQSGMGMRLSPERVGNALAGLPAACSAELMVHPGRCTNDVRDGAFCRAPGRAHEAGVLQSAAFRAVCAGWTLVSYRELRRPEGDGRPTLLLYGKLTPGTGNAETARRYAEAWQAQANVPQVNVRFRALPPDGTPATLAGEALRLREFAWRERLDLAVGIHVFRAGAPLAAAFAGHDAPPLAYGLLASGTDANADVDDAAKRPAMEGALRHADFLLCLTDDMRRRLAALPLPDDCTVLPNGIDVRTGSRFSLRRELRIADDAPLVLLPAALRRLKGVLPTIEALAPLLATRFTRHVFVVLGPTLEADYGEAVRARIATLAAGNPGLSRRLLLHPGLPREDYLAALREADLVLNSSDHEGLSHALAEAMACGTPVLARDIAGNRALVRDGGNGRLFAGSTDFTDLPRAYAECFEAPGVTAALAVTAQHEIALRFPATAEQAALQAVLARWQARRQVRVGDLRLDLAAGTHPVSRENQALFAQLSLSPHRPRQIALAADIGCGCGVFGAHLLAAARRGGCTVQRMLFADPHRESLAALERSLVRHAGQAPLPEIATLSDGSLLTPLLQAGEQASLICANLPQTPGPRDFRLDRFGGEDGADLICRFLADLPQALAAGGEAFLLHIGLAHPARVAATLTAHGLFAETIAAQTRTARLADYAALQAELPDYLLTQRTVGRSEFEIADADAIRFTARLLRIRHAAGQAHNSAPDETMSDR